MSTRIDPVYPAAGGSAAGITPAPENTRRVRRRSGLSSRRRLLLTAASIAAPFLVWFLATLGPEESRGLLPPPAEVLQDAVDRLGDGRLISNAWSSIVRVLIGFTLGVGLAIPVGFVMGWYESARTVLDPWIQFLRTIPPIALIPLVILFLGIGEEAKVFLIFFASFLACVIATFQGVRNVELTLIKAARVLGARDRDIFLRVVVPASLPFILVGMRIAIGSAWGTLVAAELIAASSGLGQMMQTAALYFQVATIIVGIIAVGVLGFVMDRAVLAVDRRLTSWQEKRQ